MILKRLVSALLLCSAFLALFTLSGCHGREALPQFVLPEEFDTSKEYEITFWAKNENNAAQRAVYAKAVADFEKLYPNIHVTLRNFTDYGTIYNDVITNIATRTTPNVCITYPDHIATYMQGENVIVPLDSLIDNEKYGLGGSSLRFNSPSSDEMIDKFMSEGKIGGMQYALPFMRSTEACYVNRDLVESLGFTLPDILTWDFVWEVCEYAISLGKTTVTDDKGNSVEVYVANGKKALIPFIYKSTDNMMISMLRQLGAPYSTDDGDINIFNDTTKGLLYEIADHTKSGAFSTFAQVSYPGNYLNAGECIFAIDSTAGSTWMGADAPLIDIPEERLERFNLEVMAIPQYDTDNSQMISQGPSLCIFNKEDPGEVLASWIFAQFLLTNEVQISYSQTEGYVPVTSKAQNSDEYLDYLSRAGEDNDLYYKGKIDATKLLIENVDNSFTTPVFNGSTSLRSAAGELIELTVGSVVKKRVIDESFMELLYSRVTALYKLDQLSGTSGYERHEIGALPAESAILLGAIGTVWLGIGTYFIASHISKRKK